MPRSRCNRRCWSDEGQPRVRADSDPRRPGTDFPGRPDPIEVVSIADGEVVLFWELPAKEAARLLRKLREELVSFEVEEFKRAWGLE